MGFSRFSLDATGKIPSTLSYTLSRIATAIDDNDVLPHLLDFDS